MAVLNRQTKQRYQKKTDIMGMALRDYIVGERNMTFIERDDGFSDREPIERYFKTFSDWTDVEQRLVSKAKGPILETGCNIGEHLKYLQENGKDAFGIDISPGAIRIGAERGVKNCFCMDARKMRFDLQFNTVLMLYYGFGIGGTVEGQKNLLSKIFNVTRKDGQIICSSIDALKTDNPKHLAYQDFNKRQGKDYGNLTEVTLRIRHKDLVGAWYNLLFVNPKGMIELVSGTAWEIAEIAPEKKGGRAWYYVLKKRACCC